MRVKTDSGYVTINKRTPNGKWLLGWLDGGGFSGVYTLGKAWERALNAGKPTGCSWYAYGLLMSREYMEYCWQ